MTFGLDMNPGPPLSPPEPTDSYVCYFCPTWTKAVDYYETVCSDCDGHAPLGKVPTCYPCSDKPYRCDLCTEIEETDVDE